MYFISTAVPYPILKQPFGHYQTSNNHPGPARHVQQCASAFGQPNGEYAEHRIR